jgi:hypothetical protein
VRRSALASLIDTAAKRARLEPNKNPYWQGVGGGRGGISLGYRRRARGPGVWVAKMVADGRRLEERLADADDEGAAAGAIGYRAAVSAAIDWSRQRLGVLHKVVGAPVPTVRIVVEEYGRIREARSKRAGANAVSRLKRYVLADDEFAKVKLSRLRSSHIDAWRSRLPGELTPSSSNRLLNDVRAALNAAVERHAAELPAHISREIKAGTKSAPLGVGARKQLLTDKQVQDVVEAAAKVDDDFGALVLLLAATGARFSQLAALTVGGVQFSVGRVMVPASRKGRNPRPKPPVAVPLDPFVLQRLQPIAANRDAHELLLSRWSYRPIRSCTHCAIARSSAG